MSIHMDGNQLVVKFVIPTQSKKKANSKKKT